MSTRSHASLWAFWRAVLAGAIIAASSLSQQAQGAAATSTNGARLLSGKTDRSSRRPSHWAVKVDKPGLPNFHQLTTNFYRGAQPTAAGMAQLKAMGIKTVINLRSGHSDSNLLAASSLKSERFTTSPLRVKDDDVARFLRIVADTNNLPVFVHCERGADRTGVMCALYRVAVCGWTKDEAVKEMTKGGFGFNPLWRSLPKYIRQVNIAELKNRAGLDGK